jgi:polyhydroxyalkanoate synthesis regulator phasin
MNKNVLRLVSGTILVAVLATSSVALAAADDKKPREKTEQTAPKTEQPRDKSQGAAADRIQDLSKLTARVLQMQDRNNAVAFLDKLVASGRITQGDANKIIKDWDDQHPNWQPPIVQLKDRILDMGNRNNVVALLDKMLAGAKITQGEYNQILNDWDKAHPNWQPPVDPITRIMEMQNRDNVVALLNKMVAGGKITQAEADQILAAWNAAHPNWQPVNPIDQIMAMGNRDNVVAMLNKLVAATRLTRAEADQILATWDVAHPNWQPVDPIQRIMGMKDRNAVVAALDKMIAAGKITQGDANKVLKDWDDAHQGWVLDVAQLTKRVMKMQNHDEVVTLLDRLVAGGRLNQGDANKILKDWEDAHASPPPATTTAKPRKA